MDEPRRKTRLIKMLIDEISLVDLPAEANSVVTIYKRRDAPESGGTGMPGELEKMVAEMDTARATIEDMTKRLVEAETRATEAEATAAEATLAKGGTKADDDGMDPILKAADPILAAEIVKLRKANADAVKQLADMAEEAAIKKAVERVKVDFPNMPIMPEKFGPVFKRALGALQDDDAKELVRVLKAADAALAEGALRAVGRGQTTASAGSAEAEIDAAANVLAKAQNISFSKAYGDVLRLKPELYTRYLVETGQGH